jgi:hypothetical protein
VCVGGEGGQSAPDAQQSRAQQQQQQQGSAAQNTAGVLAAEARRVLLKMGWLEG